MSKILITNVTGATPVNVFVADAYGNNREYLGSITGNTLFPVPPDVDYYPSSIFNTAPSIMLILVDSNGCEKFKIIDCTAEELIAIRTEGYWPITTETGIILIP